MASWFYMKFFLCDPWSITHPGKEFSEDITVIGGNMMFTRKDILEFQYKILQKQGRNDWICMKFDTGIETP